jgi:hypothetical protein
VHDRISTAPLVGTERAFSTEHRRSNISDSRGQHCPQTEILEISESSRFHEMLGNYTDENARGTDSPRPWNGFLPVPSSDTETHQHQLSETFRHVGVDGTNLKNNPITIVLLPDFRAECPLCHKVLKRITLLKHCTKGGCDAKDLCTEQHIQALKALNRNTAVAYCRKNRLTHCRSGISKTPNSDQMRSPSSLPRISKDGLHDPEQLKTIDLLPNSKAECPLCHKIITRISLFKHCTEGGRCAERTRLTSRHIEALNTLDRSTALPYKIDASVAFPKSATVARVSKGPSETDGSVLRSVEVGNFAVVQCPEQAQDVVLRYTVLDPALYPNEYPEEYIGTRRLLTSPLGTHDRQPERIPHIGNSTLTNFAADQGGSNCIVTDNESGSHGDPEYVYVSEPVTEPVSSVRAPTRTSSASHGEMGNPISGRRPRKYVRHDVAHFQVPSSIPGCPIGCTCKPQDSNMCSCSEQLDENGFEFQTRLAARVGEIVRALILQPSTADPVGNISGLQTEPTELKQWASKVMVPIRPSPGPW